MLPDDLPQNEKTGFALPPKQHGVMYPLPGQTGKPDDDPAVGMIREKIAHLYEEEPNAKEEAREAQEVKHRSKHQQYMYDLSVSGKSLAEIQTAWHSYYAGLPDNEKHEVWREFYASNSRTSHYAKAQAAKHPHHTKHQATVSIHEQPQAAQPAPHRDARSAADIEAQLLKRVSGRAKLRKKDHVKSLAFGLSMGFVVMVILLFSFFNERFIAPFVRPSRSVSGTSIIINPASTAVGPEATIIIPKINVEAPVIYSEASTEDKAVQKALEQGVLHYATTPNPGELGNGAIFGHSSGNIFNSGKYKFAFILLKSLTNDDIFYIQKDGKRYAYKVFDKKIVKPNEVSVLNSVPGKPSTFTLITCDPPGMSTNRLVIVGEQISPDPTTNAVSKVNQDESAKPAVLPSNSPTLWNRLWKWLTI